MADCNKIGPQIISLSLQSEVEWALSSVSGLKRYFNFNLASKIDDLEAIFVTLYLRKFNACDLLYSVRTYKGPLKPRFAPSLFLLKSTVDDKN